MQLGQPYAGVSTSPWLADQNSRSSVVSVPSRSASSSQSVGSAWLGSSSRMNSSRVKYFDRRSTGKGMALGDEAQTWVELLATVVALWDARSPPPPRPSKHSCRWAYSTCWTRRGGWRAMPPRRRSMRSGPATPTSWSPRRRARPSSSSARSGSASPNQGPYPGAHGDGRRRATADSGDRAAGGGIRRGTRRHLRGRRPSAHRGQVQVPRGRTRSVGLCGYHRSVAVGLPGQDHAGAR